MGAKKMILGLILFIYLFPNISLAVDNEELKFGFYVDSALFT